MYNFAQRILLLYYLFGVPALLSASFFDETNTITYVLAQINVVILAGCVLLQVDRNEVRRSHLFFLMVFASMLVASAASGGRYGSAGLRGQFIDSAFTCLWMSVYVSTYVLVDSMAVYRWVVKMLDFCGIVVSGSVYLGYALFRWRGIEFGEVVFDEYTGMMRMFGPLGDNVGFVIVLFALQSLSRRTWLAKSWFIVHLGAILITGTRGALLSLVVGGAFMLFAGWRSAPRGRKGEFGGMLGVMGLGGVVMLAAPLSQNLLMRMTSEAELADGISYRFGAMNAGVSLFYKHPVFGLGTGAFRTEVQRHMDLAFAANDELFERGTYTTQNQYLQMAVDGGVVLLVVFLGFLWHNYKNMRAALRIQKLEGDRSQLVFLSYFVAVVVGNQAMVWWLNKNSAGFYFMIVLALSERYLTLGQAELRQESLCSQARRGL